LKIVYSQNIVDSKWEGAWEMLGCPELHIFDGVDGQGAETPFADGGCGQRQEDVFYTERENAQEDVFYSMYDDVT